MKNIDPQNKFSLKSKFILTLGVLAALPATWVVSQALLSSHQTELASTAPQGNSFKVKSFKPGTYELENGKPEMCPADDFDYMDDKKHIYLGARNAALLTDEKGEHRGEDPEDPNCIYAFESKRFDAGSSTTVQFVNTSKCKGVETFRRTSTVVFSQGIVTTKVTHAGAPQFDYSCTWKYAAAGSSSKKSANNNPAAVSGSGVANR